MRFYLAATRGRGRGGASTSKGGAGPGRGGTWQGKHKLHSISIKISVNPMRFALFRWPRCRTWTRRFVSSLIYKCNAISLFKYTHRINYIYKFFIKYNKLFGSKQNE